MRNAGKIGLAAALALATVAAAEAKGHHKARPHKAHAAAPAKGPAAMPDGDWRTINRDLASTRFSPLQQINRANVSRLAGAWTYSLKGFNTAVPLVVDGVMYLPAGTRVVALDADTGKEIWVHTEARDPNARGGGVSTRGVAYWPGDRSTPARILVMAGSKMIALDARTGELVKSFGEGGYENVGVGWGGVPTIAGDVAVIGAATTEDTIGVPGNTRAFDVRTGKKLWEFQSVPAAGQFGHETWGDGRWWGRSGANMWGFIAPVDLSLGLVYVPLGGPSPNYWGGDRPGANLFGNTLVALDIKTGERRWHFQTVHHDIWDSDMPTAGPLIELNIDGKKRPAIVDVSKTSWFFEFDRATGKPLFDVVEKPVPKGDVPGEYYSPTQPFPSKPGPLSRVSMTKADMVTADETSPEHVATCQALWDKSGGFYSAGPFTPFMYHAEGAPPRSSIQFPGGIGGVNWGGPAADPRTGWVYVNALDTSLVGWVEKKKDPHEVYAFDGPNPDQAYDRASVDGKGPFFSFQAPLSGKYDEKGRPVGPSLPCYKPPWARLTAIDANTGQIKWAVPLGLQEGLPAGKQLVGNAGSAGPTVTAGGLVFIGATNDKRFRAFDSTSGKQLWEAMLPGNGNANPMSYRGKSGRQYVAINAGGTLAAYALP